MNWPTIDRRIPKLRTWHLLGIIAATAGSIAVFQFRWTTQDQDYAIIRRLRSMDAVERTKAMNDLYLLRSPERRSIAPLTEMLLDNDPGVRAAAAIPSLVVCLSDREPEVRIAAATALGQLGPDATVTLPTLEKLVETDPDPRVRQAATRSRAILLRPPGPSNQAP